MRGVRCRTASSPSSTMRPRSGRTSPAIMLMMRVLPAPDGPNSAGDAAVALERARERKVAEPLFDVDGQHVIRRASARRRGAPSHSDSDQRDQRNDDRDDDEPQRGRIAARHLRERVDRRRDGLRLARNVGDEGDRGAEFAERAGEASTMPAMMPGSASGSVTVANTPRPVGAERRGGVLQPAVDRLDRQPDRPHHQRKRHDAAGQRRAGPAEREDDAESPPRNAPTGPRRPKVISSR